MLGLKDTNNIKLIDLDLLLLLMLILILGFHSHDQQPCFSTRTKENVCITKEFNSRRIESGHQHGGRDIM